MQGANDPRGRPQQSDQMVAAVRKAGKPVDSVFFREEGRRLQKWTSKLGDYRKTEDFLAQCLGGRSSGFDYQQLGAWAF